MSRKIYGEPKARVFLDNWYVLYFDPTKPNVHFQEFMKKFIGKRVKIKRFEGKDEFGFSIVRVESEDKNIDISYICWREYDFEYDYQKIKVDPLESDYLNYDNNKKYKMYGVRGGVTTVIDYGKVKNTYILSVFPNLGWHGEWLEKFVEIKLEKELFEI